MLDIENGHCCSVDVGTRFPAELSVLGRRTRWQYERKHNPESRLGWRVRQTCFPHWPTQRFRSVTAIARSLFCFIAVRLQSRLVRWYKLLYKPWAKSIGEGDFRPSTARRPLDRFSWNLKYITTSRTRPRMQNFRGLRRHGWSVQIASLTHESFCPFFSFLSHAHRSHFWTHSNVNTSLCVVPDKEVPFGGYKD